MSATGVADGGHGEKDDARGGSEPATRVSSAPALVLLGWIEAIKATGATLATVSLLEASQSMGLSAGMRSAAASAISLAIAATAVAAGVAADRVGRRRMLMVSYVVAGVANIAIFLFPVGPVYVAGLALAGVGYSVMLTGSYAYTKAVAPGRNLGMGLGVVAMLTTIIVMVTSLGGGALAFLDWRVLFLVVPVMCAVSLVLTPRLLPTMPRSGSGRVDYVGLALLGAAMVTVITGVDRVTAHPPDRTGWLFLIAGVALFGAWAFVESRSKAAAFPVRLFRSRMFVAAVLVGLTCPVVTAAIALGLGDGVQFLREGSAFASTLALEPFYIAGGVGGLIAGRLLRGEGAERRVMSWAPLVAAVGFVSLAPLDPGYPAWLGLPGVILAGMGIGATLTAQGQVIICAVSKDSYGAVTSSKTSISQLGSALGMVLTMLVVKVIAGMDLWADLTSSGVSEADIRAAADALAGGAAPQAFPEAMRMAQDSLSTALHGVMLVAAGVMTATSLGVWALVRGRRPDRETASGPEDRHAPDAG